MSKVKEGVIKLFKEKVNQKKGIFWKKTANFYDIFFKRKKKKKKQKYDFRRTPCFLIFRRRKLEERFLRKLYGKYSLWNVAALFLLYYLLSISVLIPTLIFFQGEYPPYVLYFEVGARFLFLPVFSILGIVLYILKVRKLYVLFECVMWISSFILLNLFFVSDTIFRSSVKAYQIPTFQIFGLLYIYFFPLRFIFFFGIIIELVVFSSLLFIGYNMITSNYLTMPYYTWIDYFIQLIFLLVTLVFRYLREVRIRNQFVEYMRLRRTKENLKREKSRNMNLTLLVIPLKYFIMFQMRNQRVVEVKHTFIIFIRMHYPKNVMKQIVSGEKSKKFLYENIYLQFSRFIRFVDDLCEKYRMDRVQSTNNEIILLNVSSKLRKQKVRKCIALSFEILEHLHIFPSISSIEELEEEENESSDIEDLGFEEIEEKENLVDLPDESSPRNDYLTKVEHLSSNDLLQDNNNNNNETENQDNPQQQHEEVIHISSEKEIRRRDRRKSNKKEKNKKKKKKKVFGRDDEISAQVVVSFGPTHLILVTKDFVQFSVCGNRFLRLRKFVDEQQKSNIPLSVTKKAVRYIAKNVTTRKIPENDGFVELVRIRSPFRFMRKSSSFLVPLRDRVAMMSPNRGKDDIVPLEDMTVDENDTIKCCGIDLGRKNERKDYNVYTQTEWAPKRFIIDYILLVFHILLFLMSIFNVLSVPMQYQRPYALTNLVMGLTVLASLMCFVVCRFPCCFFGMACSITFLQVLMFTNYLFEDSHVIMKNYVYLNYLVVVIFGLNYPTHFSTSVLILASLFYLFSIIFCRILTQMYHFILTDFLIIIVTSLFVVMNSMNENRIKIRNFWVFSKLKEKVQVLQKVVNFNENLIYSTLPSFYIHMFTFSDVSDSWSCSGEDEEDEDINEKSLKKRNRDDRDEEKGRKKMSEDDDLFQKTFSRNATVLHVKLSLFRNKTRIDWKSFSEFFEKMMSDLHFLIVNNECEKIRTSFFEIIVYCYRRNHQRKIANLALNIRELFLRKYCDFPVRISFYSERDVYIGLYGSMKSNPKFDVFSKSVPICRLICSKYCEDYQIKFSGVQLYALIKEHFVVEDSQFLLSPSRNRLTEEKKNNPSQLGFTSKVYELKDFDLHFRRDDDFTSMLLAKQEIDVESNIRENKKRKKKNQKKLREKLKKDPKAVDQIASAMNFKIYDRKKKKKKNSNDESSICSHASYSDDDDDDNNKMIHERTPLKRKRSNRRIKKKMKKGVEGIIFKDRKKIRRNKLKIIRRERVKSFIKKKLGWVNNYDDDDDDLFDDDDGEQEQSFEEESKKENENDKGDR